jgi:NTE family protein
MRLTEPAEGLADGPADGLAGGFANRLAEPAAAGPTGAKAALQLKARAGRAAAVLALLARAVAAMGVIGAIGEIGAIGAARAQGTTNAAPDAATAVATPMPAAPSQPQAARPRVGLVLGGGGARGAAHVGVLEVLERLRVPVDCVAGTSMGALVAGAWAAGLSPAQMREELGRADWADMFQDNPDYAELNFRNKRLSQRFLPGSEAGLQRGSAVAPPGVVSAQKIKLFINRLVRADAGERELQQLPLPVSIIATDIGTGERVVLRDGSLTQAMRASMSVPGLMAPLALNGRRLVDGGLTDNLPVREVRERCDAEVVIAVNVGTAPLRAEDVGGLLSVSAQVLALLTEQNVQATLAALKTGDVYIQPDLGSISAVDFDRHAGAAERGRAAAEAVAERLQPLAVDAERWAAWQQRLAGAAIAAAPPRIAAIEVVGLQRVSESVVRRYLTQPLGEPLDTAALDRAMGRTYGDGWYERVDYSVVREPATGGAQGGAPGAPGERHVLRVMPVEKSWGPDYLRLGLRLDSNLSQGSTYQLRAAYHRTWINTLGGELLFSGELGSTTGVGVEWLQPVSRDKYWYIDALADYRRERNDYFFVEQRIAEYRSVRWRAQLAGGLNLSLVGTARGGWREWRIDNQLDTGIDILASRPERSTGGWFVGVDFDQLDRLYFPRRGWSAEAEYFDSPRRDYARIGLDLRGALTGVLPPARAGAADGVLGSAADWVLGARLSWAGSPRGALPLDDAARLGGFLNLTAFASGQLIGDDVGYAHVRAERIIGRLPLGLRGDMRLGLALEAGRVGTPYTVQKRSGTLRSLAVYLGGETPLGPVYLGIGRGSGGSTNAYLFIGTP